MLETKNTKSTNQKMIIYVGVIVVVVVLLIIWARTKSKKSKKSNSQVSYMQNNSDKNKVAADPVNVIEQQQSTKQQKAAQFMYTGAGPMSPDTYTFSTAGSGLNAALATGPAMPNTYTWQSLGPRYGPTVGSIPDGVQAINSPVANWVGSFAPIRTASSSC
jgi:hypothetical protein